MKAVWNGENDPVLGLINGKEYEILGTQLDNEFFKVIDESEESYMYPAEKFTITEGDLSEFNK